MRAKQAAGHLPYPTVYRYLSYDYESDDTLSAQNQLQLPFHPFPPSFILSSCHSSKLTSPSTTSIFVSPFFLSSIPEYTWDRLHCPPQDSHCHLPDTPQSSFHPQAIPIQLPKMASKSSAVADQEPIEVLVALHDKFELLDFAGPVETLAHALHDVKDSGMICLSSTSAHPAVKTMHHPAIAITASNLSLC